MEHDGGEVPPRFNLVDEPWIRVLYATGETRELSLREVFSEARDISSLCNDLPTQDFAILRVLLAVLQRALSPDLDPDDPEDDPAEVWGRLWDAEQLPLEAVNSYLDDWHDRFDLFDTECPFMQVAGLHKASGEVDGVSKMVADVPDGIPFFTMRTGRQLDALTFPEAARWLVHLQAFDPSGIKSGVVGDPHAKGGKSYPIGTGWAGQLGGLYARGRDLRETLVLNLVLSNGGDRGKLFPDDDLPCWERAPYGPAGETREPSGYADLYTWQSRRVLLRASSGFVDGVLITNGDKLSTQNRFTAEPMTAWKRSSNQEKKLHSAVPIYLPWKHQKDRALWRGLDAILPSGADQGNGVQCLVPGVIAWLGYLADPSGGCRLPEGYRIHVRASGFVYGTQDAVYDEAIDDELAMSAFLVSSHGRDADTLVRECIGETDGAVFELGRFARNLHLAAGDQDTTADGARDEARRKAYFELDGRFRTWLASLGPYSDLIAERARWRDTARGVLKSEALDLVIQASSEAHVGHPYKVGSREEWMTAARAEAIFFSRLSKLLPELGEGDNERDEGEVANG